MDSIRSTIERAILAVKPDLPRDALSDSSTLSELGLDSVRLVEVGVHLEHELGAEVSFDAWLDQERLLTANAFSIGSLVKYIQSCGHAEGAKS